MLDKNKVTVLYGIPVFILYLEFSILVFMIDKIIAESFKGIVLININICIHRFLKQLDLLFDAEICVMGYMKPVKSFVLFVLIIINKVSLF